MAWAVVSSGVAAEDSTDWPGRIEALVADLSADDFPTRDEARKKLESLAATLTSPAAAIASLRRVIDARLAAKPVDFEVRATLEAVRRRLPAEPLAAANDAVATPDAIDAIFRELESNRFAEREQAAERLRPAATKPATCGIVMLRIKEHFDDPALDLESVRRLTPLWTDAWSTWLTTPPQANEKLPAVTDQEIAAQIERLIAPLPAGAVIAHPLGAPYAAAERELLYWLARDDAFPRVRDALEKRFVKAVDEALPFEALERLQRVFDWSRPAMVAEFWQNGEQKSMQHLLIGVPNQPAGAQNASLFDRCDEKVAHCVSGNSLSPGDWPVGIFFPHPSMMNGDAQFHLKNLPTPRRRLSYEYEVPTIMSRERQLAIDRARRTKITRRTCEYFLERNRDLSEKEMDMLTVLDADEVSRFVGLYLQNVPDQRVVNESPVTFGNGSSHGNFCYKMFQIGTAEAGPAMAAAIDKKRIMDPTDASPFRMEWICLLALTERVAWPGCDDWLAAQLDRTEAMDIRDPKAGTTGASAAALLIRRHGGTPSELGLERRHYAELIDLENPCYRLSGNEGPAIVKKWWQQTKETERKAAP